MGGQRVGHAMHLDCPWEVLGVSVEYRWGAHGMSKRFAGTRPRVHWSPTVDPWVTHGKNLVSPIDHPRIVHVLRPGWPMRHPWLALVSPMRVTHG